MKTANDFISKLFEIEVNMHIAHLQTTSYSQHMALKSLYEDIVDIRDRFAEAFQNKGSVIKGYKDVKVFEGIDPIKYLDESCEQIYEFHESLEENYLQAIVEDAQELLYSTKYKLRFLK